ncbi:MAG: Hsp70 family protein, partial [Pirellulaceae bacterium]
DFDERIATIIANRFVSRHGIDPRTEIQEMQQLWRLSRELKHALTDHDRVPVHFAFAGLSIDFELSRGEFEDAIEPLIERSMSTTREVVREAGVAWHEIDAFLLVGGSSRIPLISRRVAELWGRSPHLARNPDELIAHGAALYAASKREDFLDTSARFDVVNVNAHSLGVQGIDVATNQRFNKILIPRNTPLPVSKSRSFETFRDGQKNVYVRLLEGESENPDFCTLLGDCVVRVDPPMPKGTQVRVSCTYAANGTISVTAKLARTNTTAYVELRRDGHSLLEPLETWTARLTTGDDLRSTNVLGKAGAPKPAAAAQAPSDKGQTLARLDELYAYIGTLSSDVTPPSGAVQTHRLSQLLVDETATLKQLIETLEVKHQRESQFQTRLELASRLAQLKIAWEHSIRLLDHTRIVLGRECVAENFILPGAAAYLNEVRELQASLDTE